jgi:hypothetical protein
MQHRSTALLAKNRQRALIDPCEGVSAREQQLAARRRRRFGWEGTLLQSRGADEEQEPLSHLVITCPRERSRTEVTPKTETLGNVTTCIEWGGPSAEMELEDPRV